MRLPIMVASLLLRYSTSVDSAITYLQPEAGCKAWAGRRNEQGVGIGRAWAQAGHGCQQGMGQCECECIVIFNLEIPLTYSTQTQSRAVQ